MRMTPPSATEVAELERAMGADPPGLRPLEPAVVKAGVRRLASGKASVDGSLPAEIWKLLAREEGGAAD